MVALANPHLITVHRNMDSRGNGANRRAGMVSSKGVRMDNNRQDMEDMVTKAHLSSSATNPTSARECSKHHTVAKAQLFNSLARA
mmetsp:Transcript_56922/g.101611  ORF Transcript_56922/g.101611 Transcript_56922/m.101611 type:complete len:85 (-) Transcript_56922:1497-1751(-)